MAVAPWIVSDELWGLVEPLLPKRERRFRYPGRKRLPDRQALQGVLFVLHTRISWTHLPAELGFGSGVTCWRRLDEWHEMRVAPVYDLSGDKIGNAEEIHDPLEPASSERGASLVPFDEAEVVAPGETPAPVNRKLRE